MSKTIRQKISHAIQTTFRSSPKPKQSKIMSCCSIRQPDDYEYIPYEFKQTSSKNDYIDLSECHSWLMSQSKDSGYSYGQPLESTRISSTDSASLATLSEISSIRSESSPTSFECCHCHCHHHVNNIVNKPVEYQRSTTKNKIYPFIF
ncbi:unnamed protein product [Adineta ricciae]|uniref:Uncharacterized protein n=1 Tax=Adineta ricciae TaxID=249248 RepID=A0A813YCH2_ADIRI|nr:unnamed protein product [Adineta ricciae]